MALHHQSIITLRTVPWYVVKPDGPVETLVFVLHGLGQRAGRLARRIERELDPHCAFVFPEAPSRYLPAPGAPKSGASWSTGEDAEADLEDNARLLDAVLAEASASIPAQRRVLVGFSQGGLTATRWIARRRHRWDRVVLWAAPLAADIDLEAFRSGLSGAELVMTVGTHDPYLTPEAHQTVRKSLDALDYPTELRRFEGRHELLAAPLNEVVR